MQLELEQVELTYRKRKEQKLIEPTISPSLSPLLPSITITIARPPPTPSARAGARVAAAAPNLSQSRRSPVDAARLAEHGGGPGGGGRPQTDPEGPVQERHALHQRGEDLFAPGDR